MCVWWLGYDGGHTTQRTTKKSIIYKCCLPRLTKWILKATHYCTQHAYAKDEDEDDGENDKASGGVGIIHVVLVFAGGVAEHNSPIFCYGLNLFLNTSALAHEASACKRAQLGLKRGRWKMMYENLSFLRYSIHSTAGGKWSFSTCLSSEHNMCCFRALCTSFLSCLSPIARPRMSV